MTARIRKILSDLGEAFWLVPAALVAAGVVLALILVAIDREGGLPTWLPTGIWIYDGGATGARTLLGAVAGSTIGVAGTVFTITIAALSLAAGQMGPRLLRNFTRDRGNQVTLGLFLGTFSYALMVLRSVRTTEEGDFVPHLALGVGILLALLCVAMLVYFVEHVASRINVDTVIELVSEDAQVSIRRLATDERAEPATELCREGEPVIDKRRGYLQQLDADGLADWAAEHKTAIRLLVRPGDYVFPGAPIALVDPPVEGVEAAIVNATALGHHRGSATDLEFAVRQMVEVAVRALSPGINDPHTAISVVDRLGAALCDVALLHLPPGVYRRADVAVLLLPAVEYDGLVDTMFHMIRQNGAGKPPLLIRLLEVLAAVASCERDPARLKALRRHADLVLGDAERSITNPSDIEDARLRHCAFIDVQRHGAVRHLRHRTNPASTA